MIYRGQRVLNSRTVAASPAFLQSCGFSWGSVDFATVFNR